MCSIYKKGFDRFYTYVKKMKKKKKIYFLLLVPWTNLFMMVVSNQSYQCTFSLLRSIIV